MVEVATLAWQQRVLDSIESDTQAMVKLLTTLVKVPSVGGSKAEVSIQTRIAKWLRSNDLEVDHWQLPIEELAASPSYPGNEVERNQAWGLVGRLPGHGDGQSLMFNGHVDVVPPGDLSEWQVTTPFEPVVLDGHLYGRGACDMKAGLVSALFAVRALRRAKVPLKGDVTVACVSGEEDGGLGTFGLLERGWRADACVITEPTGMDIVPANGGALTFRLHVPGRAAHASRRTVGVSALERFLPIFTALRDLERDRNHDVDPLMAGWDIAYPIEIGTVSAGDWVSSVPDGLAAEGRLGVALGESVVDARLHFEATIAAACRQDPWLSKNPVTVEWWGGQFAAGRLRDDDFAICERVQQAHTANVGTAANIWGAPYGSDLRLLTELGKVPTLQYGPGDVSLAHAADESVPIEELLAVTRTLALLAIDHCGVDGD